MLLTPELQTTHATGVRVGCDVHPVGDTTSSIAQFGGRYLARVFTTAEQAECEGAARDERLAARFAAKEAVFKLLRPARDSAIPWSSIEVTSDADGRPTVTLTGRAAELAARSGLGPIEVSLSHDAGIALAVAAAPVSAAAQNHPAGPELPTPEGTPS